MTQFRRHTDNKACIKTERYQKKICFFCILIYRIEEDLVVFFFLMAFVLVVREWRVLKVLYPQVLGPGHRAYNPHVLIRRPGGRLGARGSGSVCVDSSAA